MSQISIPCVGATSTVYRPPLASVGLLVLHLIIQLKKAEQMSASRITVYDHSHNWNLELFVSPWWAEIFFQVNVDL